jgi:hypothetical protein
MSLENPERDFESLLNPVELRTSLILVALYVLAYESFRDGAIDHVHTLYWWGIDESGNKYNEDDYRREILSRHKSPFRATLHWYQEMGALDEADLATIANLTKTRNRLVHHLMRVIGTKDFVPELGAFPELVRVYRKLEVWNVLNLEIAGDPDWEGKEIDEKEVIPGAMIMVQVLTDIALGKDDDAWIYYRDFVNRQGKQADSGERST